MRFEWRRDLYSCIYTLVSLVLYILGAVFFLQEPKEVNVVDVQKMDAPYVAVLLAAYTSGAIYGPPAAVGIVQTGTGTLAPPTKFKLETLGSSQVIQSMPSGTKHFGLDSSTFMLVGSWMNNPDTMARQFQNVLFTGQQKEGMIMASPMWVYEHNLHLLDPNFCTMPEISQALTANRANGVNPSVAPVPPALVPARVLHCSPAYPTAVDYKGCYKSMVFHKTIFGFYAIFGILLWIVSTVFYVIKATTPEGVGHNSVPYVQLVSFIFHVLTLGILSFAIHEGIPALYDKKDVCPNKQTGLLSLYETFFAVFVGIIVVVAMHISEEIRNRFFPYVETEPESVNPGGYSCNFPP